MHETIEWLYGLQHFGMKLGLENIHALVDELGRPQTSYRNVHVAGTNGKGSVAATIDALLGAAGIRSGLFTSPHLVHPGERVRILGRDIRSEELHERLGRMRVLVESRVASGRLEAHPSFFEVMTAVALEAFRDHAIEAAVLEVGLGGRLDATNAVDAEVGVIVGISLDHTKTLGTTLEAIAAEKAGIVKPGMTLVHGAVQQRVADVVRRACDSRGARRIDARAAVSFVGEDGSGLTLRTTRGEYPGLRLALAGRHQIDNARIALAAFEEIMERLGRAPDPDRVREGLASVRWPGRLQWIAPADGLPGLLLDGAHNPAGVEALVRHLAASGHEAPVLLFGATSGRPLDELLEPLSRVVRGAVITAPAVDRRVEPEEAAVVARRWIDPVRVEADPARALAVAREMARAGGSCVLVTGSLYLVGSVLGLLSREEVPGPVAM